MARGGILGFRWAGRRAGGFDKLLGAGSGNIFADMQVQIDSFEDNGMALLLIYPGGRRAFDVPSELLPDGSRAGDVFEVRFVRDADETRRSEAENRRLTDELLGRDGRLS